VNSSPEFSGMEYTGGTREGIVFRKSLGTYTVHSDGEVLQCGISSKLRKHLEHWWSVSQSPGLHRVVKQVRDIREVDPVAIGDRVRIVGPGDDAQLRGMIVEVLPRRNRFSRLAAGPKPIEQVIVANVDQMVAVFSLRQPKPKWALLDRYLAAAEAAGVPAAICITKIDLVRDGNVGDMEVFAMYRRIGYRTFLTSAVAGEGIDSFAQAIGGRVSVLVGKSGVGKTSLLNAIQPGLGLRVREVSQATGKGRHATSHLEMFPLDAGGGVVDTPGMREFGLWHDPAEGGLASLFVEMRPYIGTCRFRLDCSHSHEPGCAIKEAVQAGDIAQLRYRNYLRILDGQRTCGGF
jgi:ribosome biogenesis GTPase